MKNKRYPLGLFLIGFVTNLLFRFRWLFVPGAALSVAGIFVDWCLYVGIGFLAVDIVVSFIEQMKIRHTMLSDSDSEQFRRFQDAVLRDGNVFDNIGSFVEDAIADHISFGQTETSDFVVDMCETVSKKCQYGDHIDRLNEHERVFFITQTVEQEVNNGGFSQFFFNSSGDFSNEMVEAFTKIGALKTAEICRKALTVFDGPVPVGREEREALLEHLDCDDVFGECDDAFFEYEDNLEELNNAYIMEHREFFD